jgi:DNA replication protein DnaC
LERQARIDRGDFGPSDQYERRSLLVARNLRVSEWENVFSSSVMTVVAVDRLVHHSTIIQINGQS